MTREEFQQILPGLVKNYKPAPDVVELMGRLNILMVVGPSGVGKTTLINKLGLTFVISDNSRPPRPGEVEGVDFYFHSDYDKLAKDIRQGRFVQVAVDSGGDLKATKASSYPESGDMVMAVMSDVVPLFRKLGFAKTTTVFITPPSYQEWMRRMENHQLEGVELQKRLTEAERSIGFAITDPETHLILSDDIDRAVSQLKGVLSGQYDSHREELARKSAQDILQKLKAFN